MKRTAEDRFALPYLGPDSFQAEDAELFFGRQRDAEQLIAMILSARCTLLHAQSGAGKTSLLNTVIIPRLEAGRHTPIRVLPQDDPIEAVRTATLQQLLPPPVAEAEALDRARRALELGEDATLGELLRRFDQLQPVSDGDGRTVAGRGQQETRRRLLSPIEIETSLESLPLPPFGLVVPWICRLLRASVEIDAYAAHLGAVSPSVLDAVDAQTPVGRLQELLSEPRFATDYAALIERLYLPIPGLRPFFENLLEVYSHRLGKSARPRRLSLVLIFDQLEELFTRFVDRRQEAPETSESQPSWRLRWQFFRELEGLYAADADEAGAEEDDRTPRRSRLPIRFVISIRNEFVAQLDAIRRMVPDLGRSTYHLKLLGKDDAATAIRDPAARYGVRYSPECVDRIVDQLALEERYVEPPYIQIICDRLWRKRGAALATGTVEGEITVDDFRALGETAGILDRFFTDFLAELGGDEERLESLEMLQRLITASGTRNIVARDELANAPFRRPELRLELLSQLQNGNIVRIERRVGTHFVEITHEFLIGPIQQALRREITRNADYREFLTALEDLARTKLGRGLREERRELLKPSTLEVLEEHEGRLRWGYLGTEAMLRGAILAGVDETNLERWSNRLREGEKMWDAEAMLAESRGGQQSRLLALDELGVVQEAAASGRLDPEQLEGDQLELVLRSLLVMGVDEDRERIAAWTREVLRDEA